MKIELLSSVGSTNEYIRRYLSGGEDVVVCADEQTGGKGTKGRAFLSGKGGVYLSALTFYERFPAAQSFRVMMHAAAAVCRAAERFGVSARIKWPNDVLSGGKKLSGILIENVLSGKFLRASIVGIGLNAENDLTSLGGIAVSLTEAAGRRVSAAEAREALIGELFRRTQPQEYFSRLAYLGEEVFITERGGTQRVTALRVTEDGRLCVRTAEGELRLLSAAEVSIRAETS